LLNKFNVQVKLLGEGILEDVLINEANSNKKLSLDKFVHSLKNCGFPLTRCEMRSLFSEIDKDDAGSILVDAVIEKIGRSHRKGQLRRNDADEEENMKTRHEKSGGLTLLSESIIESIAHSVRSFQKKSDKSLWKLTEELDESKDKERKFSSKGFRALLKTLHFDLSEDDEDLLFSTMKFDPKFVHSDDVVTFFTASASHEYVNFAHMKPIFKKLSDVRVPPKDLSKAFVKYDSDGLGYIDRSSLEKAFEKLKISLNSDELGDLEHVADPDRKGLMDFGVLVALATITIDTDRAVARMKNCVSIMAANKIEYDKAFSEKKLSEDAVVKAFESLNVPIVHPELQLIASRYASRGKVDVEKMLKDLLPKVRPAPKPESGEMNDFGKGLFKKICLLRSNKEKSDAFRKSLLSKDSDMTGHIPRRDFQRALEHGFELTDEEAALLCENMAYTDGRHAHDIDYASVLLMMFEPQDKDCFKSGCTLIAKQFRGADSIGLKIFISLLFRNFSSYDSKGSGLVPVDSSLEVLQQECESVDKTVIKDLLFAFTEKGSDCVYYPELLSYLSCCSVWYVIHKLHDLNMIRKRQGYDFCGFLVKTSKKLKIDKSKILDMFLSIGFILPDISYSTIFHRFGEDSKSKDKYLKAQELADAIENLDNLKDKVADRKEVSLFHTDNSLAEKILRDYDARMKIALEKAFDQFDPKNESEIPAIDLDRVLCCVGYKHVPIDDIGTMASKIDPRNKGVLEYSVFMEVVLSYLREHYEDFKTNSFENMQRFFRIIDENNDGSISYQEFSNVLRISSNDVDVQEVELLVTYLDRNGDGVVDFQEFKELYHSLDDKKIAQTLEPAVRDVLLKLRYHSLPDPEKYLYMFQGMPTNFRLSTLADIEEHTENNLRTVAMSEVAVDETGIKFDVQILKVTGIPSESFSRAPDILVRGVKLCVCRCSKPPTEDSPGDDPDFVGNVVKLHATLSSTKDDCWRFSNKDETGIVYIKTSVFLMTLLLIF